MVRFLLEKFALWSGLFILVCATLTFFLPYASGPVRAVLLIVVYVILAAATTILAIGHILLTRRSASGKASVWLTSFTHSKTAQSFAFWGIVFLTFVRLYGIDNNWVEGIGYAMVGIAAGANLMSSTVFVLAWRTKLLDYPIWPSPFQVLHRRVGGRKE